MKNNIKQTCEIVQDLLPLYVDGICSDNSRKMVEEHLIECEKCRNTLKCLRDTSFEKYMQNEKESILLKHAKKERTAAWKAGAIIAGILMLPVFIAIFFTIAGNASIGTLFVLVASMIFVAALTVLPLMTKKNRFAKMIVASTAAIVLVEFFVCTFFDGGTFIPKAVSTIFGISVVFFPFVVRDAELPDVLEKKKSVIVLSWDSIWLYLTVMVNTLVTGDYSGFRTGVFVSTAFLLLAWLILIIIRLDTPALNRFIKSGIISATIGIWYMIFETATLWLKSGTWQQPFFYVNLGNWTASESINANVSLIALIMLVSIGIVLIIIGLVRNQKKTVDKA